MVCARLPGSTQLKKILHAFWSATRGSIVYDITTDALLCSNPFVLCGPAPALVSHKRRSSMIYCSKLPFEVKGSVCILVTGLLDAFATAFNLRRTHRGPCLKFKELTYGRIKMMSALCPAWAHTYQTICLGCHLEQLGLEAFRLPKPKKNFPMLPTCRTTTRMTGIESPGWRLFTALCGFASTTLLLVIARTTGIGCLLGASNNPARQAGTPLSFLTFMLIGSQHLNS